MEALGFTADCHAGDPSYCGECVWHGSDKMCGILRPQARAHRHVRIYISFTDDIIRVIIYIFAYTGECVECREVRFRRHELEKMEMLNLMVDAWQKLQYIKRERRYYYAKK